MADDETVKYDLYLPGEERFGAISSKFYGIVRAVPTLRRFYSFVENTVLSRNFENLLDIGSGPGITLLDIAKRHQGSFMGIDPSPHMVRIASRKAAKLGMADRVRFSVGSSRNIPGNEKFDLIYTSLSFHHWKDREQSIDPIVERLKPSGRFMIFEVTDDGSFNRRFVMNHLMSRRDFEILGSKTGREMEFIEDSGFICCILS
ncbi:MAG: class I SAM-dependent methyltransferase [Candidatus Thermoplasmatota archaeon]|nr:class I SAM-dependent methyltransferase [Candidatus Thermoplasmatota archaeon]